MFLGSSVFINHLTLPSFTFKDGTSNRTHIGFIAQDVEDAMKEVGLTDIDFAGFCKDVKTIHHINEDGTEMEETVVDENGNPEYIYSLRYGEFIALIAFVLQDTVDRLDKIDEKLSLFDAKFNRLGI